DQTDRFFGDADRVYPTASGAYMTWRLPRLRRFVLTFYAEDAAFAGYVGLAVSSGNEGWTEIPFRVVQEGEASDGMQRLLLIGEVPEELAAEYIRLTWHGGGGDTVQLGHAEFKIGRASCRERVWMWGVADAVRRKCGRVWRRCE